MTTCGKVSTRTGRPCRCELKGGKCPTHDSDLSKRNAAVRAAFAVNDPEAYHAHQGAPWRGKTGDQHFRWKGDQAARHTGRHRAQKLFAATVCEQCGATAETAGKPLQRHHKDGNPLNNAPGNVEILCEDCHVAEHTVRAAVPAHAGADGNGTYVWFAEAHERAVVEVPVSELV